MEAPTVESRNLVYPEDGDMPEEAKLLLGPEFDKLLAEVDKFVAMDTDLTWTDYIVLNWSFH